MNIQCISHEIAQPPSTAGIAESKTYLTADLFFCIFSSLCMQGGDTLLHP
jgi:hypothetical protein